MVDRSSDRRPSASSVRATDRQTGRPSDRWMGTSELECLSNRADWQPGWLSSTDRKENERANEGTSHLLSSNVARSLARWTRSRSFFAPRSAAAAAAAHLSPPLSGFLTSVERDHRRHATRPLSARGQNRALKIHLTCRQIFGWFYSVALFSMHPMQAISLVFV